MLGSHLNTFFFPLSLPSWLLPPFLSPSSSDFFPNYPILVTFLLVFYATIPEITLNSASPFPRHDISLISMISGFEICLGYIYLFPFL